MNPIKRIAGAFLLWLLLYLLKGGETLMTIATIYATLIIEGDKTFEQVPSKAKPEVKRQLELLGYPDLAQ